MSRPSSWRPESDVVSVLYFRPRSTGLACDAAAAGNRGLYFRFMWRGLLDYSAVELGAWEPSPHKSKDLGGDGGMEGEGCEQGIVGIARKVEEARGRSGPGCPSPLPSNQCLLGRCQ